MVSRIEPLKCWRDVKMRSVKRTVVSTRLMLRIPESVDTWLRRPQRVLGLFEGGGVGTLCLSSLRRMYCFVVDVDIEDGNFCAMIRMDKSDHPGTPGVINGQRSNKWHSSY